MWPEYKEKYNVKYKILSYIEQTKMKKKIKWLYMWFKKVCWGSKLSFTVLIKLSSTKSTRLDYNFVAHMSLPATLYKLHTVQI